MSARDTFYDFCGARNEGQTDDSETARCIPVITEMCLRRHDQRICVQTSDDGSRGERVALVVPLAGIASITAS